MVYGLKQGEIMKNKVNIGLIGWGTIGGGVVKILRERKKHLSRRVGARLQLKSIVDLDIKKARSIKVDRKILSREVKNILFDPEIDIVVQLIGGEHPAKNYITTALKKGKSVVTANKALLAEHGKEIFKLAWENNAEIGYEASVCGGIPLIRSIKEGLLANKIKELRGIINGTSNYILTQMEEENCTFNEALRQAKKRGYAEVDPGLDISGLDSAHKLAILASLTFGTSVALSDIYVEGIDLITPQDIRYARELGYVVKLLAIAKEKHDQIEARVHPVLISADYILASVRHIFNAVCLKGDKVGELIFYGAGAGEFPTASSVVSDICDIASKLIRGGKDRVNSFLYDVPSKKISPINKLESRYYVRFTTLDNPGVLAKISRILGRRNISIASVIQKQRKEGRTVPIVMMTHKALEENMRRALGQIDKLSVVKGKTVAIRVEEV